MHPLLETIYAEGSIEGVDGARVPVTSHVSRDEAALLYRTIERAGQGDALEVGMAFGVSSLALADALAQRDASSRLVVMDPAQHDGTWQGLGLLQLERAGLAGRVEFHERPSQAVLPELWTAGRRFTVAFLDGWHTFDHTLVDAFYADRVLQTGGYLVLDDVGYPAIRRLTEFLMANRAYEIDDVVGAPSRAVPRRLRRALKRFFARLARTDVTPSAAHQTQFRRLDGAHTIALRKLRDDDRPFDHFAPF